MQQARSRPRALAVKLRKCSGRKSSNFAFEPRTRAGHVAAPRDRSRQRLISLPQVSRAPKACAVRSTRALPRRGVAPPLGKEAPSLFGRFCKDEGLLQPEERLQDQATRFELANLITWQPPRAWAVTRRHWRERALFSSHAAQRAVGRHAPRRGTAPRPTPWRWKLVAAQSLRRGRGLPPCRVQGR